jgi:AcrR family transcriptional regulator
VSIREIAKRAGVNHGLIHRHFGSKENLRRITLQHMADTMLADVKGATTFDEITNRAFRSLEKHERFWRILARTLLDGRGVEDIHGRYPMAEYITGRVKAGIESGILKDNLDPRVTVAIMFSFSCGFSLFEPFVLAASGLDRVDPAEARKTVFKEALSLILSL